MSERNDALGAQHRHRRRAVVLGLGLMFGLLLAACALSAIAMHQRVIPPPAFAIRLGHVEIAAPCPPRGFSCDESLPWYAIWRGDDEPDGSITYRQLFFVYLRPTRRP